MLFRYPGQPHSRRHGPRGYADYRSYKPWLRDEFSFRCIYCLWRETWCAEGDASFSVDHLQPQYRYPDRGNDYANLVYACCRCNTLKQDAELPLDPGASAWSDHLLVRNDGTIEARTPAGAELIAVCRLDRPALTQARRRVIGLIVTLTNAKDAIARDLLQSYCGFPHNLPALASLRPPDGNALPDGIATSYYELRQRGLLPITF